MDVDGVGSSLSFSELNRDFARLISQLGGGTPHALQQQEQYNRLPLVERLRSLAVVLSQISPQLFGNSDSAYDVTPHQKLVKQATKLLLGHLRDDHQLLLSQLSVSDIDTLKRSLLHSLQCWVTSPEVAENICLCIVQLANILPGDEGEVQWPDLVLLLMGADRSRTEQEAQAALLILRGIPFVFGSAVVNQEVREVVSRFLTSCMRVEKSAKTRNLAVQTLDTFLETYSGDQFIASYFESCAPLLLQIVQDRLDDIFLLRTLRNILSHSATLYQRNAPSLIDTLIAIIDSFWFSIEQRVAAMECVSEIAQHLPSVLRQYSVFLARFFRQLLELATEKVTDDVHAWSICDSDIFEGSSVTINILSNTAKGLGGRISLPLLKEPLNNLLESSQWKHRYTALFVVGRVSKHCRRELKRILFTVVRAVHPFVSDDDPRVRSAAGECLNIFSEHLAPEIHDYCHDEIVKDFISLMHDENVRVNREACGHCVTFLTRCSADVAAKHLNSILSQLESVISSQCQQIKTEGGCQPTVLQHVLQTVLEKNIRLCKEANTLREKLWQRSRKCN